MAEQIVPDSQTQEQCNDIEKLRAAVTNMDCLSQGGFSETASREGQCAEVAHV